MPRANPRILVRPATRADIPAIVAVSLASVTDGEEAGFGTPRAQQTFADVVRLEAAWANPNRVRGEEVLVAEVEGRVVGCTTVEDRGDSLELVNIDVPRDRWGRGIGTAMVRHVEARARREGKPAVTLGTSRNAAGVAWKSLPWWEHQGYRITHEEENAWTRAIGPGTREIRMRKEILRADRVRLREVEGGDLDLFFDQQRDPEASRMAAFTAKDPDDRTAFMQHWSRILHDDAVVMRSVVVDGRVVGNVGRFVDPEMGKPEVTYWIDRAYWGQGLATSALGALLAEQRERPIYARAAADNAASIRVLEKCGFTPAGRSRGFANARGMEIEEFVFELKGGN